MTDKLVVGGVKTDYDHNVGKLSVKKENGVWRGMTITVNESHRGRGAAFELMRRAVKEVGPLRTSGVFSPHGSKQMEGLVKRGYADELPGGDYLIHFRGSAMDKIAKRRAE